MTPTFREEQRLTQWWIRLLIFAIASSAWWSFIAQIVLGESWGSNPAPDWAVWLFFLLIGWGLPALIILARLIVTVDDEAVRIRWIPFAWRTIRRADIRSAEMRTYRPFRECGGWGVRWSGKHGMVWSASGNQGVHLDLASGRQVLIGSQCPENLAAAIRGDDSRR
jgi:hypothetical protein